MVAFRLKLPEKEADLQEVSRLMRTNCDILKEEITKHVDTEIERFKKQIEVIRHPGYFE